ERNPSARWYAEKLAVPAQPLLDADIPLRLIDCLRDPRDVLVSIRAFTAATGVDGFGRRPGEPESRYLPRFVEAFARGLDELTATPPSVDRTIVRYEDVIQDISWLADRLGCWLDVPLDPHVAIRSRTENPHHLTT